jgi:hypothetical protein
MSPTKTTLAIGNIVLAAVTVLALTVAAQKRSIPDPIFREDLHPSGYPQKLPHQSLADYTDLTFLSDDLILVSLNERSFANSVEPVDTDKPPSKLLLFDISRKALLRSSERAVEKFMGSVHATHDGSFVVLEQSGIRVCFKQLECGPPSPIAGIGPIFVSPRGTKIMAGGNAQNEQRLLDADSLQTLNHFAFGQAAMPGDTAVLATRGTQLYLLRDDTPDKLLNFRGGGLRLDAQFLSDDVFATYENDRTLVGVGLDGAIRYRILILPQWSLTDIVPAASGSRFCIHQQAHKVRGTKLSVGDYPKTTSHLDIYRIFDTHSGEELFHFQWDPWPYISTLVAPAISPSGHRLAVIHSGYLEIFELP